MQPIALPKNIEFLPGERENQGTIIVEPCYPGYGITLGNSIRRVMLSSLPGAAVVGVKIKGADHEFMTLPHVKEDVLEIILNIKKLRLKMFSDEPLKLELDVHGEKTVTAADITKNSQIEIINEDLEIANITDMAGNLHIEFHVARGRGYETVESREQKQSEIGYIEIDSIYSPVTAVSVNIENVRVGKMTNWDKLIMKIDTDGSLTPEEAFYQSVDVLISQFNALKEISGKEPVSADEEAVEAAENEENIEDDAETDEEQPEDASKKKRGRPKKSE